MSIFFEFDSGSNGRRFRRAVDDDRFNIGSILNNEEKGLLFDDVDLGSLIELSTLSICMIDEAKEVVGFLALCDHPNIPAVDPADWEVWIRNMYQKYFLSRNTLFIHFLCCTKEYEDVFLSEALLSVFYNDAYLQQIILVVPLTCPPSHLAKHKIFKTGVALKIPARMTEDDNEVHPFIYAFMRNNICTKLKIRRAVQEDNDDVVTILDKLSPQLKEEYGNFYISEIIGFHPESKRKILVAEYKDKVVGVMCLNAEINYQSLQAVYELRAFHGLKKASAFEQEKAKRTNYLLKQFGEPVMRGSWSPFTQITEFDKVKNSHHFRSHRLGVTNHRKPQSSKVNFQDRIKLNKITEHEIQKVMQDPVHDVYPNVLDTKTSDITVFDEPKLLLDDDSFDYEIVNIDMDLLALPEAFSSLELNQNWAYPKPKDKYKRRSSKRNSVFLERIRKRRVSLQIPAKVEKSNTVMKVDDYGDEPNAFIIELFGLQEDLHQSHAFEFLESAFEAMPSFEYCLIRVPSTESNPLLQHFTYVPKKSEKCIEYALYIAHKNSVLGRLRVRKTELVHVPLIAQLLHHEEGYEIVWAVENGIQSNSRFESYVLYCGLNLIGVAVLHTTEHLDFTRARYNFNPYHNNKYHSKGQDIHCGFATIQSMIAYSAFQPHFRYFAREVLRLSGHNSLLWLTARRLKLGLHRYNNLAEIMVPLIPRACCIDYDEVKELRRLHNLAVNTAPFMLWFLNKRITGITKATVDTRIVVIGASRTAMAFFNTLLFSDSSSYLTFNSVSLISPNGFPYTKKSHDHAETMFVKNSNMTEYNLKCVPYQYYVNVVEETLVGINKREKCITLSNGSKYYYDLLFLLIGKQYQHPDYMKPLLKTGEYLRISKLIPHLPLDSQKGLEKQPYTISYQTPANVFIVNDIADANISLSYVSGLSWSNPNFKILVYGASINAYCCLATLLDMGIHPDSIIFIEPFPPEDEKKSRIPIFSNVYVDHSVREILDDYGLTIHRSYYFQSWTVNNQNNLVTHVEFLSHFHMIKLECSAFFYYGRRGVNEEAFIAINKSGIGYNAGILIDHEFRTKDPSILAAGPCTRYYSRYYAEDRRQKYFDSYEIGEKLGTQVRNQLDPLFRPKDMKPKRQTVSFSERKSSIVFIGDAKNQTESLDGVYKWRESRDKSPLWKLPDLRKPLVTYCMLPGHLQYLDVRSPGLKKPHPYLQSLTYNGIVMETFKRGYFKIHCTNDYIIDGITCLTPWKQSIEKFKNLYGFSSVVLNHVCLKFATKKIDDFYDFFNMPWAQFLYYDNLRELLAMVQELYPQGVHNKETLREGMITKAEELENSSFRMSTSCQLHSNFEKSPYIEAITNYVIEWLNENDLLLPLYFQNMHQPEFHLGVENHEAFKQFELRLKKSEDTDSEHE